MATIPEQVLMGQRFIADPTMTKGELREVSRSWKERLFTLPWRPMKKTQFISVEVPSDEMIFLDGVFYAHPKTIERVKAVIKEIYG